MRSGLRNLSGPVGASFLVGGLLAVTAVLWPLPHGLDPSRPGTGGAAAPAFPNAESLGPADPDLLPARPLRSALLDPSAPGAGGTEPPPPPEVSEAMAPALEPPPRSETPTLAGLADAGPGAPSGGRWRAFLRYRGEIAVVGVGDRIGPWEIDAVDSDGALVREGDDEPVLISPRERAEPAELLGLRSPADPGDRGAGEEWRSGGRGGPQ